MKRQFRGIPPVLDTPIYPKMLYCCLRISQKFLTPDSMIIMYYIYILLYYVFHKIPDSMTIILYIPSFVDHCSLFGWFNSLFVSTKILDLPEKNRKRSQRSWAHYCYQEHLDEAAFGANDRPGFFEPTGYWWMLKSLRLDGSWHYPLVN